ncbi:carbohydrate ABC transporter permease [Vallitalea sp.]|jgi:multiple sugar transport system permease protein|uniref:carbohydrate ABC transporter permease n=1 Tax=Vallitalea sp. TaxID=1882829 RepID=UPI0025E27FC4|nr:carbohydrate ABC transporter permease [Vallitalea sp.]MCT4687218.1 carbohydrate ABC transporter permease [Vallitalea sp.]
MNKKYNNLGTHIILILFAIITIIPMAWGIGNAFRSNEELAVMSGLSIHTFIPKSFTLSNFVSMFSALNFTKVFTNTLFIALIVTIGNIIFNAMAGFAFARLNFPGKNAIFIIFLATLMVPLEVLIIPLYNTLKDLHMMNSYSALIIPFIANAFGIFYFRQFISNIPKELDEAAIIDGCNQFGIFGRIILPLLKSAMVTLGIIVFLQQWDSFIVPVTVIHSKSKMVLQVALQDLQFGLYSNDYGVMFAGIVVSALPVIIVFLFLQKYYVEGISSSGLKG